MYLWLQKVHNRPQDDARNGAISRNKFGFFDLEKSESQCTLRCFLLHSTGKTAASLQSGLQMKRSLTDRIRKRMTLYEKATCYYLAFSAFIAVAFHHNVEKWDYIAVYHLALIAGIFAVNAFPMDHNRLLRVIKDWYILIFFPILFKELTFLSSAIFPYYLENLLISSERSFLFLWQKLGLNVQSVWLGELMAFSYCIYYLAVPLVGGYIYRKRPFAEFEHFMLRFSATMFFCYGLFILIPVRGPHHTALHANPLAVVGGPILRFVHLLQDYGATVGAAFPSSHVAATWIVAFSLKRVLPKWYRATLPFFWLLTVSVFYLRYHYVLDAIFGYALALGLDWYFERVLVLQTQPALRAAMLKSAPEVQEIQ